MPQSLERDPAKPLPAREAEKKRIEEAIVADDHPKPGPANVARRRRYFRLFLFVALALVIAGAVRWWLHLQGYETTDDAQIEGHLHSVSARVSGTVSWINPQVENNRYVEAGTLLLTLDPGDYEAELEHAKANLDTRRSEARSAQVTIPIVDANAFGRFRAAEAAKEQAVAMTASEQANLLAARERLQQNEAIFARAERDRLRYLFLVEKREISRSDYDARETEAKTAAHAVEADRAAITSAEYKIAEAGNLVVQRQAEIEAARTAPEQVRNARANSGSAAGQLRQAAADVRTAELNLSYTKIYAAVSGVIGRKTVELGNRVQPGQGLLIIVPPDDIWVIAYFKETQIGKMRSGQPVTIYVDTFKRSYRGSVEGLPAASGPSFSLFPPENASGNYVKVVQRFPVRIRFGKDENPDHLLRPGMSVEPTVTVR